MRAAAAARAPAGEEEGGSAAAARQPTGCVFSGRAPLCPCLSHTRTKRSINHAASLTPPFPDAAAKATRARRGRRRTERAHPPKTQHSLGTTRPPLASPRAPVCWSRRVHALCASLPRARADKKGAASARESESAGGPSSSAPAHPRERARRGLLGSRPSFALQEASRRRTHAALPPGAAAEKS